MRLPSGLNCDGEDAARHRRELADQVEVVADLPRPWCGTSGRSCGTPSAPPIEQFVLCRMPVDGHQAALERAGRDAGDVVDEPLRRHLGQLHRAVAADRDQVRVVLARRRCRAPSRCGRPGRGPACRSRRRWPAACCRRSRRRPSCRRATSSRRRRVSKVTGSESLSFLLGDIPDLHFAEPARRAAGDRQQLAVGREGQRLRSARTGRRAGPTRPLPSALCSSTS